jgi:hypothetical protein
MADESQYKGKIDRRFYLSQKALGQLFRAVDLPKYTSLAEDYGRNGGTNGEDRASTSQSPYETKVMALLGKWLELDALEDELVQEGMQDLLDHYCAELGRITVAYKLTKYPLYEAEVFISALAAPRKGRKRRYMLADVNKEMAHLLGVVRGELDPMDIHSQAVQEWKMALQKCGVAWKLSMERLDQVGGCSFNMIVFEHMHKCTDRLKRLV